jgi:hypothetical protein
MRLVVKVIIYMFRSMMAIIGTRRTEHHIQDHTRYIRPTVKEHDHHWDLQQDLN